MADQKVGPDVYAALGVIVLLAIIGSAIGDTTIGVLLTPFAVACAIYAMTRVPLRTSLMALMFLSFTLENPGDAENKWKGPLHTAMSVVNSHWNIIDRSMGFTSFMSFSGMDLCLVALFAITFTRRQNGSNVDRLGHVKTPRPLVKLGFLTLAGIGFTLLSGMMRGGSFKWSLWQLDRVMYLPMVFFLSHMGFRGPKDLGALAKVVLVAAAYKAAVAIYVVNAVDLPPNPETGSTRLSCATNHADFILFAVAFVLVVAMFFERVKGRGKWFGLALLPLITGGMIANGRRMVWVEVAAVFLVVYMVSRDNPVKRAVRRALYGLSPVIAGYLVAGWESKAGIFKPAQMVRSVVDPQSDGSTLWRELENYDIITTYQMHPLIGSGYGHPYLEFIPLPQIPYELEHYAPHNSILGLWCYSGYLGYFAITLLWCGGVYFGMRAYHAAKEREHRAAALVSFGSVVIYLVQCWGDMGLGTWNGVFTVAPSIAMAGKLLVATGEWGARKPKGTSEGTAVSPLARAEQAA